MIFARLAEIAVFILLFAAAGIGVAKVVADIWIEHHRQASEEDLARVRFEKDLNDLKGQQK